MYNSFNKLFSTRFLKISLIVGSVFLFYSAYSQDKRKADSLISLLEKKDLSQTEILKIQLHISKTGLPQKGLEYAQKAYNLANLIGNDTLKGEALEEISLNQRILGNKIAAVNASFEALKIYEKINLVNRLAAIYSQLGVIYIDNKNFIEGIRYLSRSLLFYDELADSSSIAILYINIGEAYRTIEVYDSAEIFLNKGIEVSKNINNNLFYAYAIGNLGMVHSVTGKLELAKNELTQAINILVELGDPYSVAVYKSEVGNILIEEGDGKQGETLLHESLQIAKQEGLKEQISDISKKLAIYYESKGQFKTALTYRKDFEIYKDSIINYENVRKIEQVRSEYEMEKKETEITFLNKTNEIQKRIGFGMGIGAFIFIILAFFLFRLYKKTRKANLLLKEQKEIIQKREDEKALLLKELNHRVKNNLQMISSLLNLQSHQLKGHPAAESLKSGKYRVEALTLVHQKLYREDYHTKIPLNEYIEELALNLVHCFDKKVNLNLELENINVDIDTAIPLGLIINELITNSLKHAFQNERNPLLNIVLKKDNSKLVLSITDNGKGIPDKESTDTSDSFGLKLVNSLIKQLNGQLESNNQDGCNWKISIVN